MSEVFDGKVKTLKVPEGGMTLEDDVESMLSHASNNLNQSNSSMIKMRNAGFRGGEELGGGDSTQRGNDDSF